MEYYKTLYENETNWGRKAAGAMGKAQGHLLVADAILSTVDSYMDPDHLKDKLERVRKLVQEADQSLSITNFI